MPFPRFELRNPKTWIKAISLLLVAAVALLLVSWGNSGQITISRKTTFLEEPVGPDGCIDYVAAVNAKTAEGVRPENNAVVLLVRALGPQVVHKSIRAEFFAKLGISVPPRQGEYFVTWQAFGRRATGNGLQTSSTAAARKLKDGLKAPWSRQAKPRLAAWLDENAKPLAIVRQAVRRKAWYRPVVLSGDGDSEPTLLRAPLAVAKECAEIGRALSARALRAVHEARIEDAHADLLACHRLARLVAEGHSLFDFLVGVEIESICCRAEIAALQADRATPKQLADYQQGLIEIGPFASPAEKYNFGERITMLDSVVKMAQGTVAKGDFGQLNVAVLSVFLNWDLILTIINDSFDRVYAVAREPRFPLRKAAMEQYRSIQAARERETKRFSAKWLLSSTERSRAFADVFVSVGQTIFVAFFAVHDRAVAREQLSILAVALERHRKAHGRFPDELADLSPRFLKTVPDDLFTEKPFVYKPTKTGYLLYSVGPNMKDDGGKELGSGNDADDIAVRIRLSK